MKLGIVVGSIRENRVTDRLAKWVENQAKTMPDVETKLIDLIDYPMPLFNEPISPRYNPNRQLNPVVKKWLDAVGECDAVALVTPEYNRSYSSAIKNAIDYLDFQVERKPVLIAAHGTTGGAQAVSHLRAVLPGVGAVTDPVAVMVTGQLDKIFDKDGKPLDEAFVGNKMGPQGTLEKALDELKWLSDAMAKAR
ncbi:MAG: NADPH-dependent FMN reductase [Candidatus Saccharimonadales bacterium]